ncbi:MAG: dTDP-4-dehydrorhamnose reductase [Enterobacterales bacterium]|jgi:dTDP-4-dehydrorhamnose reductase
MKKKKVLITGGSGLLGINWALAIKDNYDVVLGLHSKEVILEGVETIKIDIENIEVFRKEIDKMSPDIIVHTAGMTNVEQCENDFDMAEYINCTLSKNIATICNEKNIKLIHISTDHLYDGREKNLTENDFTCPVNVYGKTKLEGERVVFEECPDSLIVRTNFFGWGGPYKQSFSDWIVSNLRAGNKIKLFDDVFYTPILIDKLACVSMKFIAGNVKGIVNIVGDERISKYDFCSKLAKEFELPEDLIERAKIASSKCLTLRPLDMSLSNQYAQSLHGGKIGNVNEYLTELKAQENNGREKIVRNAFR